MKNTTVKWIEKIAALNGVKREEVLKYLKKLSSGSKVIHHLKLA